MDSGFVVLGAVVGDDGVVLHREHALLLIEIALQTPLHVHGTAVGIGHVACQHALSSDSHVRFRVDVDGPAVAHPGHIARGRVGKHLFASLVGSEKSFALNGKVGLVDPDGTAIVVIGYHVAGDNGVAVDDDGCLLGVDGRAVDTLRPRQEAVLVNGQRAAVHGNGVPSSIRVRRPPCTFSVPPFTCTSVLPWATSMAPAADRSIMCS